MTKRTVRAGEELLTATTSLVCARCGGRMELLKGVFCPTVGKLPDLVACLKCGCSKPAERKDGKPRTARKPAREKLPESYVQRTYQQVAKQAGFIIHNMSEHRKEAFCDPTDGGCGRKFVQAGGSGMTPGLTDLATTHERWPRHDWVHYECKGSETPWSNPDQEALYEAGRQFMFRHPSVGLAQLLRDHRRRVKDVEDRSARFLECYLKQYPAPADLVEAGAEGYALR